MRRSAARGRGWATSCKPDSEGLDVLTLNSFHSALHSLAIIVAVSATAASSPRSKFSKWFHGVLAECPCRLSAFLMSAACGMSAMRVNVRIDRIRCQESPRHKQHVLSTYSVGGPPPFHPQQRITSGYNKWLFWRPRCKPQLNKHGDRMVAGEFTRCWGCRTTEQPCPFSMATYKNTHRSVVFTVFLG